MSDQKEKPKQPLPEPDGYDQKEPTKQEKIKFCPLIHSVCHGKNCAWWSKYHEACAIHTVNEIPRNLYRIHSSILSLKKLIEERIKNE